MFGVSKQAFYKRQKALQRQQFINDKVIEIVQKIRKRLHDVVVVEKKRK